VKLVENRSWDDPFIRPKRRLSLWKRRGRLCWYQTKVRIWVDRGGGCKIGGNCNAVSGVFLGGEVWSCLLRSAGFDVKYFLPIGGVGTKCQEVTGLTDSFDSTIATEMAVDMYREGGSQNQGVVRKERRTEDGEWRMRVDTERGKAFEGLSGSCCAEDGTSSTPAGRLQ
jgi:hypothetical protein